MNKFLRNLKIAWNIIKVVWLLSIVAAGIILIVTVIYLVGKDRYSLGWVIALCIGSFFYLMLNMALVHTYKSIEEDDIKKGDDAFKKKLGYGKYKVIDKIHEQPTLFSSSHHYIVIKNVGTGKTKRLTVKEWIYDDIEKGEILNGIEPPEEVKSSS